MYCQNNCDEKSKEETASKGKQKANVLTKIKKLFSTRKNEREKHYFLYNTWKRKEK